MKKIYMFLIVSVLSISDAFALRSTLDTLFPTSKAIREAVVPFSRCAAVGLSCWLAHKTFDNVSRAFLNVVYNVREKTHENLFHESRTRKAYTVIHASLWIGSSAFCMYTFLPLIKGKSL